MCVCAVYHTFVCSASAAAHRNALSCYPLHRCVHELKDERLSFNKASLHHYIICISALYKLYVKRPKQTGFILFPGTEHVRGSMVHLIPLDAALKSWYSSSRSTCCWVRCRMFFFCFFSCRCLNKLSFFFFFALLFGCPFLFWTRKKTRLKGSEQWGVLFKHPEGTF